MDDFFGWIYKLICQTIIVDLIFPSLVSSSKTPFVDMINVCFSILLLADTHYNIITLDKINDS